MSARWNLPPRALSVPVRAPVEARLDEAQALMQHEDVASQWFEQGDEADARETIALVRRARLSDPLEPSPLPCWSASAVLHGAFMALVLMIPPMAAWDMFDAVEPAPVMDRLVSTRVMLAPPSLAPALPVDGEALLGDAQEQELGALAAGDGGQAGRSSAEQARGQRREARRQGEQPEELQETLNALRASASDATSLDGALGQLRHAQAGDGVGQDGLGVSGAGRGGAGEEQGVGLAMLPRRPARKLGALGVLFDGDVVGSSELVVVRGREPAAALGCLTPSMVEGAVQRREPQLRACYQAALLRRPAQSGRLTLRIAIGPDGQPDALEADSGAMHDPMLEACIEDQLATLRFPSFDQCEAVVANFPLRFKPVAPRP